MLWRTSCEVYRERQSASGTQCNSYVVVLRLYKSGYETNLFSLVPRYLKHTCSPLAGRTVIARYTPLPPSTTAPDRLPERVDDGSYQLQGESAP